MFVSVHLLSPRNPFEDSTPWGALASLALFKLFTDWQASGYPIPTDMVGKVGGEENTGHSTQDSALPATFRFTFATAPPTLSYSCCSCCSGVPVWRGPWRVYGTRASCYDAYGAWAWDGAHGGRWAWLKVWFDWFSVCMSNWFTGGKLACLFVAC